MDNFVCDQTISRDRLQRQLDWMNPKTGIRRRLLDLFYESGTRWTWHTVLGLVLAGVPFLLLLCVGLIIMAITFMLSLPFAWFFDLSEDILRWFSGRALARYRRVQKDLDGIISSGNTEPQ